MAKSSTFLNRIRTLAFNKKYTDDNIDNVLNKISDKMDDKNVTNQLDVLRNVISSSLENTSMPFNDIFSNITTVMENRSRIYRYINADDVCDNIPYCARALKVLSDEIVAPNEFTKDSVQILNNSKLSDEAKSKYNELLNIVEKLGIEENLIDIVTGTLKYGDFFVEICDANSIDNSLTQSFLNESKMRESGMSQNTIDDIKKASTKGLDLKVGENNVKLKINITEEYNKSNDNRRNEKAINIDDVKTLIHSPRLVIKLQSRRFKYCLGYLILPDIDFDSSPMFGSSNSSFSRTDNLSTHSHLSSMSFRNIEGIDQVYKTIVDMLKVGIGDDIENKKLKKDVYEILNKLIASVDENDKELNIRYVPVERMTHFHLNRNKYFPYGEGIFQKVMFQAKLLIALETATTIKRLSDSTEKRIMYVRSTRKRGERNRIEELKQQFEKKRYSLDTFGSIGSIPSSVSSFEYVYIPTNNRGDRPVEFDRLDPTVNIQNIADELKFFRDVLVSSLDVPPSYVGLEENLSNKSALSQESIVFAKTILSYQKIFSRFLKELLFKIYRFAFKENIDIDVSVTFPPPKFLEVEILANHIDSAIRLIDTLANTGIPKEYLMKKYLTIPWDEIEKYRTEDRLNKEEDRASKGSEEKEGTGYSSPY